MNRLQTGYAGEVSMHEVSIVESLIDILKDTARENGLSKITRITLRIGQMRQIVPEAMKFAFEVVGKGTVAEGAEIIMNTVPTRAQCNRCAERFPVDDYCFLCPSCGGIDVAVVEGKELFIDSLEGE